MAKKLFEERENDAESVTLTLSAGVLESFLRENRTPKHIAKILGVSESYVSHVRSKRRNLRLEHLVQLEKETNVSMLRQIAMSHPLEGISPELRGEYLALLERFDEGVDQLRKLSREVHSALRKGEEADKKVASLRKGAVARNAAAPEEMVA